MKRIYSASHKPLRDHAFTTQITTNIEGLPLTIIEAMTANFHIVYSNVEGVRDILQGYSKKSMLLRMK